MLSAGVAFGGVLTLPSVWYSLQTLLGRAQPYPRPQGSRTVCLVTSILLLVLLPLVLAGGHFALQNERISWLVMPALNILATGLPILWLITLGQRGLRGGSLQRKWGAFASGLVLGPTVILTLELAVIVAAGMLGMIWLFSQPGLLEQISRLGQSLTYGPPSQEAILNFLTPYLNTPGVVLSVLIVVAVIVPLIEELFKPIAVWLLAWKGLVPAEGFVIGLISGAGFALFENIGNTSTGGSDWALLAATRITTALLHITTSGMVGWALVSAWKNRSYLRLGLIYALAVVLHGLWNGMALLGAATLQTSTLLEIPNNINLSGAVVITVMAGLVVINFTLYLGLNRRLQSQQAAALIEESAPNLLPTHEGKQISNPLESTDPWNSSSN